MHHPEAALLCCLRRRYTADHAVPWERSAAIECGTYVQAHQLHCLCQANLREEAGGAEAEAAVHAVGRQLERLLPGVVLLPPQLQDRGTASGSWKQAHTVLCTCWCNSNHRTPYSRKRGLCQKHTGSRSDFRRFLTCCRA